jgi:hypothetical protein
MWLRGGRNAPRPVEPEPVNPGVGRERVCRPGMVPPAPPLLTPQKKGE